MEPSGPASRPDRSMSGEGIVGHIRYEVGWDPKRGDDATRIRTRLSRSLATYEPLPSNDRGIPTEPSPTNHKGIFTELLPRNDKGTFTEQLLSNDRGDTQTHSHREKHDLISLLLFFKIRKVG
jgi:hypothetical protein